MEICNLVTTCEFVEGEKKRTGEKRPQEVTGVVWYDSGVEVRDTVDRSVARSVRGIAEG